MNDTKQIDDGGPAFPCDVQVEDNSGSHYEERSGLSIRDWFAATISLTPTELDLIMSRTGSEQHAEEVLLRYQKADAMLAARNKKE